MPPVSESQRRWAFANKDKKTKEGRAAKEFADADQGGKLPENVGDKDKRTKRQKALYNRRK